MKKSRLMSMAAIAALFAGSVYAADSGVMDDSSRVVPDAPVTGEIVRTTVEVVATPTLSDNDYVTLSGTVGKVLSDDEFELNYGSGVIKVDTNDSWPEIFNSKDTTAYQVKTGDHVTVSGRVDKDWLTESEIEAESVTFGAAPDHKSYGDNSASTDYNKQYFTEGARISLTGTVAEIDGNEFILKYPGGTIQIDTDKVDGMKDAKPLAVGERVTVYGAYDKGVFEKNEIQAETIGRSGSPSRAN